MHPFIKCSLFCFTLLLLGCGKGKVVPTATQYRPSDPAQSKGLIVKNSPGDMGKADFGESKKVTLKVLNNSGKKLTLELAKKACACSTVKIDPVDVESAAEASITFDWSPKPGGSEPGKTRLWADVTDSKGEYTVRVEAEGELEPAIRLNLPRGGTDLPPLSLENIQDPLRAFIAEVYTTDEAHKDFTINKLQVAEGWTITNEKEPLPKDRLAELKAIQGYRVTLQPTKNLPTGTFISPVSITTQGPERKLELQLRGSLENGAVSLSSPGVILPISQKVGQRFDVPALTIKIRYGQFNRMEIKSIDPGFLDAKLVPDKDNAWKLSVSIPENLEPWRKKVGENIWQNAITYGVEPGSIVISTDHPDIPFISIHVSSMQFTR